jgi:hypothetical protein
VRAGKLRHHRPVLCGRHSGAGRGVRGLRRQSVFSRSPHALSTLPDWIRIGNWICGLYMHRHCRMPGGDGVPEGFIRRRWKGALHALPERHHHDPLPWCYFGTSSSQCAVPGLNPLAGWGVAEVGQPCSAYCASKAAVCNVIRLNQANTEAEMALAVGAAGQVVAAWCSGGYGATTQAYLPARRTSDNNCYCSRGTSTCGSSTGGYQRLCPCDCPVPGQYWNAVSGSCTPACPAGTTTANDNAIYSPLSCQACPVGTISTAGLVCSPCPDNTNTTGDGTSSIAGCLCKAGYQGRFNEFGGKCVPCPRGMFKSDLGSYPCQDCEDNTKTHTDNVGSKSADDCVADKLCAANAWCVDEE